MKRVRVLGVGVVANFYRQRNEKEVGSQEVKKKVKLTNPLCHARAFITVFNSFCILIFVSTVVSILFLFLIIFWVRKSGVQFIFYLFIFDFQNTV